MGKIKILIKYKKLVNDEKQELKTKYALDSFSKLPKIKIDDALISKDENEIKVGDVIEISREYFSNKTKYYREVVEK